MMAWLIGAIGVEPMFWIALAVVVIVAGGVGALIYHSHRSTATHLVSVKSGERLEMDLKEEFVTRREFEKHEARVDGMVSEIKGLMTGTSAKMEVLFERTMESIDRRDKAMAAKVETYGASAYRGRQKLWEQTNENREDIAGLKATGDVAKEIGKLGEALQANEGLGGPR